MLYHRILTGRRNTCIATLASRADAACANVKNCFEIARAIEPIPKTDHPMWKLHCDAVNVYNEVKEKMKAVHNEEEKFLEGVKHGYEDGTADDRDEDGSEVTEDTNITE